MRLVSTLAALALALASAPARATDPAAPPPVAKAAKPASPAAAQLERLRSLAGTWTGKAAHGDAPASDVTVVWRVTGGGSAVVETIMPGTDHEMVSVYHLDGDQLLLTHYCAAGNQPTMRLRPSKDPDAAAFEFVRGTNMKPGDMHMHAAKHTFLDADHVRSEWTSWKGGKPAGGVSFSLARQR